MGVATDELSGVGSNWIVACWTGFDCRMSICMVRAMAGSGWIGYGVYCIGGILGKLVITLGCGV